MTEGKRCPRCGAVKALSEYNRNRARPDGLQNWCRDCDNERRRAQRAANRQQARERARESSRRWRAAHPDQVRERDRRWKEANREQARESARRWRSANLERARESDREGERRRRAADREAVLDHFGRACACCGSSDRLEVDHVNGDGKAHREALGVRGGAFYRLLVANGFPDDPPLQVLCGPCNGSKGKGPACRIDHSPPTMITR